LAAHQQFRLPLSARIETSVGTHYENIALGQTRRTLSYERPQADQVGIAELVGTPPLMDEDAVEDTSPNKARALERVAPVRKEHKGVFALFERSHQTFVLRIADQVAADSGYIKVSEIQID